MPFQHIASADIYNHAMDLRQLGYFLRVAELGSFTKAAHALQVAQPALSRQIRQLEIELRQTLLLRNGRGATPTDAGRLLMEHARGILHQVERAQEDLARARGGLSGRVAIGLPPSLSRLLAVPLVQAFRGELPQAQLTLTEGLSSAMQDSLIGGQLDLALLYRPTPQPGIEWAELRRERLYLVQARAPGLAEDPPPSPLPLAALRALPLVIPRRPHAVRMQLESEMAALGLRPRIAMEIDGVAAILDLVADGAGSAVLSRQAVSTSLRPSAYALRPLGEPPLSIALALARSSQRPTTLTQQAAMTLIERVLATAPA